jgi:hypothetical protein
VYGDWKWIGTNSTTFARSGSRWRFRTNGVSCQYFNYPGRTRRCVHAEGESTFDGKSCLMVSRDHRGVRELQDMSRELGQEYLNGKEGGPIQTSVAAEVDAEKPVSAENYAELNQTNALYGYLPWDGRFVTDVLRQGTTRMKSRSDSISGRPAYVLEGATPYGRITLALDPAQGFAPLFLQEEKSGDDLWNKVPMRSQKAQGNSRGPMPYLPWRKIESRVDYRTGPEGGRVVIEGYTRIDHITFEGGADYWLRYEATLSDVVSEPTPQDLEPTIPIPEGSLVNVRNAPSLRARWVNGHLVLDYDKPTVAALKANWVSEGSTSQAWRRPLVLATLGLVVASLCVLVWKRFHRTSSGGLGPAGTGR